jgi:hypothetical protein
MKQKIKELIQHHKSACEEVKELLNELHGLEDKDIDSVSELVDKYSEELALRGVFIGQLEDLL